MTTTVNLLGCDGSVWNLLSPSSPVRLSAGLGGLHLPPVRHRWATTSRRSGSRWKGSVTEARTFSMNLFVGDMEPPYRTGDAWRRLDGQFWKALSTEATSTLVVNDRRRLSFRLDDDNDFDFRKDPALLGKAVYSVSCIAEQPEWFGEAERSVFKPSTAETVNYYGGPAGVGPPFIIDVSSLTRIGRVSNPGDLPSYPVWTITGPAGLVEVGVPGRTIKLPFPLIEGDVVVIDARAQTIMDPSGNNLWPQMGSAPVDFAPIPPGDSVEVVVGMDQWQEASAISVDLTTRYLRAWGDDPIEDDVETPVNDERYPSADLFPSANLYPAGS